MMTAPSDPLPDDIILACTWQPRGELSRLLGSFFLFRQTYRGIALALPPDVNTEQALLLQDIIGSTPVITADWAQGRHAALQKALELPARRIHYADMERLLHWVEVQPEEWRNVLRESKTDCLIIGRTERAWATYPLAIQETERSINNIFSSLLGKPVDLGGGSRIFSRAAAMCLLAYSPPENAPGTDAEWPVLLHRAGFAVDYLAVDGLEWEWPDRLAGKPADEEARRRAAAAYDQDIAHWLQRASLALKVIQAGVEAWRREIPLGAEHWREQART